MATKFVLVGLASDGPSDIPYKPTTERDMLIKFGANYTERFYLDPTASGLVLQYIPWRLPTNIVDGRESYLYFPTLPSTGNSVMYFGTLGGTGTHTVDLRYTPYLGEKDVLVAAARYYEYTGELPYVVRLGGARATLSVEGWNFESKFAGERYNYLGIYSDGTDMTVFGLEPNYVQKTYTGTAEEIKSKMRQDFNLGVIPVYCSQCGSAVLSVGYNWFANGTDGTFTDADVETFLTNVQFPIDATHILLLSPLTSAMITSIRDHLAQKGNFPRMFFIPAPAYFSDPTSSTWRSLVQQTVPYRLNMVSSFVGDITVNFENREINRYAAEGAAIAFQASNGTNLTNIPVIAKDFQPVLSEDDLIAVKEAGFVSLMRYIQNDISIYEGTTTAMEHSFLYSSKVSEIISVAYDYCFQFFGMMLSDGDHPEIAREVLKRLNTITYIIPKSVSVTKKGEEMIVWVEATFSGEILTISFTIQNR